MTSWPQSCNMCGGRQCDFCRVCLKRHGHLLDKAQVNIEEQNRCLAEPENIAKLQAKYSMPDCSLKSVEALEQRADGLVVMRWKFDGDFDTFDQDGFLAKLREGSGGLPLESLGFERGSIVALLCWSPLAQIVCFSVASIAAAGIIKFCCPKNDGTVPAVIAGSVTGTSLTIVAGIIGAPVIIAGGIAGGLIAGITYIITKSNE